MFYLKELYFRTVYLCVYFIYSIIIIYTVEDYIFDFFFFRVEGLNCETAFTINSPLDFIEIQFYLSFLFSLTFFYPLFIINIKSFIHSALTPKENKSTEIFILNHICYYTVINTVFLMLFLPNFWYYVELTNSFLLQFSSVNVEYEPGLLRYVFFIYFFFFFLTYFM